MGVFKFFFLISGAFCTAPQVLVAIWIGPSAHGMFEKYETHDIPFFLWDSRSYIFNYHFENVSGWQPLGKLGEGGCLIFLFVWFSKPYTRAFTIPFGHRGWIVHRFGPLNATCPIWPHSWEKENVFLYLLDVHTTKLGYVLFPPHPKPSKEVLSYLFKDPQNKYFSWLPPPIIAK